MKMSAPTGFAWTALALEVSRWTAHSHIDGNWHKDIVTRFISSSTPRSTSLACADSGAVDDHIPFDAVLEHLPQEVEPNAPCTALIARADSGAVGELITLDAGLEHLP